MVFSVQENFGGPPAGLLRRFGAMVSDTLVVIGMMVLATFITAPPLLEVLGKKALVPGEVGWGWTLLYWALMLMVWSSYFVLLWSRSGQTVGMRAWRLRVEMLGGGFPTPGQALGRLWWATAPWIPGYLVMTLAAYFKSEGLQWLGWALLFFGAMSLSIIVISPVKQAWHDKKSASRIILLPKP